MVCWLSTTKDVPNVLCVLERWCMLCLLLVVLSSVVQLLSYYYMKSTSIGVMIPWSLVRRVYAGMHRVIGVLSTASH